MTPFSHLNTIHSRHIDGDESFLESTPQRPDTRTDAVCVFGLVFFLICTAIFI